MPAPASPESLESALDELYGVEPTEFVDTRKRLAGELRTAGETAAAKALGAARRPTTAAWALNQLSRTAPEVVEAFLARSDELQSAQVGAISGDREAMRDATRAQRQALASATDAAVAVLGSRATDAYRTQVLATLHAAGADEEIGEQLRKGRLIREVSGPTGFPDAPGLTLVPDLDPETRAAPSATNRPKREPRDSGRSRAPADAAASADARQRDRERAAAEQAAQRRAEAEAAWLSAQQEVERAEEAATAARVRVNELKQDLDGARREARTAEDRAERARREAARLARAMTKLQTPGRSTS